MFLQHLACITEFQLREGVETGCISRIQAGTGLKLTGTGGDGLGSDGDRQGSGSTFVPVQFSNIHSASPQLPRSPTTVSHAGWAHRNPQTDVKCA